ncbi:hypothetical protein [Polaromonas sp.]|uniref:hypothetical protein n=1 Tax=Polaromonas sp. TaxID=1869339 RepID=UPI0017D20F7B|nr:hypothetical protein [Polaromonas sp.]NML87283.1 hypothetical protein [Polaromonas sp.]
MRAGDHYGDLSRNSQEFSLKSPPNEKAARASQTQTAFENTTTAAEITKNASKIPEYRCGACGQWVIASGGEIRLPGADIRVCATCTDRMNSQLDFFAQTMHDVQQKLDFVFLKIAGTLGIDSRLLFQSAETCPSDLAIDIHLEKVFSLTPGSVQRALLEGAQ